MLLLERLLRPQPRGRLATGEAVPLRLSQHRLPLVVHADAVAGDLALPWPPPPPPPAAAVACVWTWRRARLCGRSGRSGRLWAPRHVCAPALARSARPWRSAACGSRGAARMRVHPRHAT
eukprot:6172850-Pleurochrysis_carterae.AAC.2